MKLNSREGGSKDDPNSTWVDEKRTKSLYVKITKISLLAARESNNNLVIKI